MESKEQQTNAATRATGGAPSWFREEIAQGIFALAALRLPHRPDRDELCATASVWMGATWFAISAASAETLVTSQAMQQAFFSLQATSTRWPVPAEFINALAVAMKGGNVSLH